MLNAYKFIVLLSDAIFRWNKDASLLCICTVIVFTFNLGLKEKKKRIKLIKFKIIKKKQCGKIEFIVTFIFLKFSLVNKINLK